MIKIYNWMLTVHINRKYYILIEMYKYLLYRISGILKFRYNYCRHLSKYFPDSLYKYTC